MLLRLIQDRIKERSSQNIVESRSFQAMLEDALKP
ncbi:MAG: hypothetical protein GDA56_24545 [Hormoscilla sp. GM7CHS1pb]|nr:hypothetical protein [Hormoscilla sp. GM7CHS1pb]